MQGNPSYALPRDYKSRLSRYLMSLDFCDRWIAIASRLNRIESSHFRHFDHSPGWGCLRIPESDYSLVARLNFTYSAGGRVHFVTLFETLIPFLQKLCTKALWYTPENMLKRYSMLQIFAFRWEHIIINNGLSVLIILLSIFTFPVHSQEWRPLRFMNRDAFFPSNLTWLGRCVIFYNFA